MTDPTPRKPQLILPIPTVYRRPSDTQKGREIVATSGSDVTASSSMIQTDVDAPTTIGAPDQHEPQPIDKQQQQQRETQESPIERELPANAKVVRGDGQGLATGLFCPLCLGDLYQFLVSEKRGFVMCPNRQVSHLLLFFGVLDSDVCY